MTGELWWRRLVNSARFLDDLKDTLADDKSVLLLFDTDIPWLDIMTETLEQKLADANDNNLCRSILFQVTLYTLLLFR